MKAKDIIRHELIGLYAEIAESANKDNVGIFGKITDETKNTLVVQCQEKRKRVFKSNVIIDFHVGNQTVRIDGKLLLGRPKERIKI